MRRGAMTSSRWSSQPKLPLLEAVTARPRMRVVVPAQAAATALEVDEERTNTANPVSRLKSICLEKVVPALKEEFKYTNTMEVPYLKKIVVNCGAGEAAQNANSLESIIRDLFLITGQRSVTTRAKKAIARFKLREDVPVGVYLTLHGEIMYSFLDRFPIQGISRE
ncbi:hypothetical protein Mapa_013493 [Marchantia paleacea]|nr:hypothetical protein Mapa_013493 [Marchantia paleacea]